MDTKTYTIKSFENLIEVGITLGQNWFRGHSKAYNKLTPGIFRNEFQNEIYQAFNPNSEFRIAEDFKRKAPGIATNLPKINNNLEWLFLMQHYGVPTRLLDWSESILIAAFFAVTKDYNDDGEIWTLLPWKLNQESHNFYGLPTHRSKILKFLANEPYTNDPIKIAEKYKLENVPDSPLAFLPPFRDPRISAQLSCFTIHPKPIEGKTIPEIIKDEKFLTKYIIPKNLKKEFERCLKFLGISYNTIFPDLEGLAKTIRQDENYMGWRQPNPPKF